MYQTMTLSECALWDKNRGLKNKITGWGRICKARVGIGSTSKRAKRGGGGDKKARYQAMCREQAKNGFIPDAAGKWVTKLDGRSAAMERDYFAGYKVR
jgi:hypothetical protein